MENQKLYTHQITRMAYFKVGQRNHKKNERRKEVSFTTFISAEADLFCNPISSFHALKELEKATDSTQQEPKPKGFLTTPRQQNRVPQSHIHNVRSVKGSTV